MCRSTDVAREEYATEKQNGIKRKFKASIKGIINVIETTLIFYSIPHAFPTHEFTTKIVNFNI